MHGKSIELHDLRSFENDVPLPVLGNHCPHSSDLPWCEFGHCWVIDIVHKVVKWSGDSTAGAVRSRLRLTGTRLILWWRVVNIIARSRASTLKSVIHTKVVSDFMYGGFSLVKPSVLLHAWHRCPLNNNPIQNLCRSIGIGTPRPGRPTKREPIWWFNEIEIQTALGILSKSLFGFE